MSNQTNSGFQITVPQDYFARIAAKEYSDDAGMAVNREFAQNSADAGATKVEFEFSGSGDGARLAVTDDGKGCSAETVKSRLLTPLGTQKEEGSVGGFGKAKELLFFANPAWAIRTRDVEVRGSFLTVETFEEGLPHFPGFRATVQLPPSLHRAAEGAARQFLRCSERPGVRWILNGLDVPCEISRAKRAAKDFGFAKAFVERDVNDNVIYLRTGGLLTATRYGYHGKAVGRVVIEVVGASSELLTPARDWFRAHAHRAAVEGWLNQLVTSAAQTLADEVGDEILFEDSEAIEYAASAEASGRDVVPAVGNCSAQVSFKQLALDALDGPLPEGEALSEAAAALRDATTSPGESMGGGVSTGSHVTPAKAQRSIRRDGFDMGLMPKVATVRRIVVHTGGKAQAKAGMKWLKKNGALAEKALAAWATAVRVVAAKAGLPIDAVGFSFAPHAEAEFIRTKGRFAMLLNPLTIHLGSSDAAEELIDRALHETAHLVTTGGHDETFVTAEFSLRRKVRGALVRGAVARALRTDAVQAVEVA